MNIKANEALRLADKNVATKKAASEKDEAEAEAAKKLHADSSAESNAVYVPGSNAGPTTDNFTKEESPMCN